MASLGLRIAHHFGMRGIGRMQEYLLGLGLGASVMAYFMFLLGILRLYAGWTAWLVLFGLLLVCWKDAVWLIQSMTGHWVLIWHQIRYGQQLAIIPLVLIAVSALIRLAGALSPPAYQDALIYHLTLPRQYILVHALGFVPGVQPYGQFPQNTEMLFLWGMLLRSEVAAQVIHWGFGIILIGLVFRLAHRQLPLLWSLLGAGIFYAGGDVAAQSGAAGNDLVVAAFQVLAPLTALRFFETQQKRWLTVSALFVGVAGGCKYTGALVGIPLAFMVVWYSLWERKWSLGRASFITVLFSLIALVPLIPWFVKNIVLVGNPVFPMFQAVFPTRAGVPAVDNLITPGFIPHVRAIQTLRGFLASPFSLTFNPDAIIGGSYVGPVLLGTIPLLPLMWVHLSAGVKRLLFVGISYFVVWYWTVPYPRFLLGALALMSIPATVIAYRLARSGGVWGTVLVKVVLLIWLVCGLGFSWYFHRTALPYVFGTQSYVDNARARMALEANFNLYDQMLWVNDLPPDQSAVLINDSRGYLLNRPFYVARDMSTLCRRYSPNRLARCFNGFGIKFILFSKLGNANSPLIAEEIVALERSGKLRVIKQDSLAILYEIVD
jgi:hypothetical protein